MAAWYQKAPKSPISQMPHAVTLAHAVATFSYSTEGKRRGAHGEVSNARAHA